MRAVSLVALAVSTLGPAVASAQCCGQSTVAYSPVVAAPQVVQATTVRDGWYPGKYLTDFTRNLFGYNDTTTYTTNYAPYTAGYAPYTAGYAPGFQTAYRPVYPATYGPVVQTVARPVVLSPVVAAAPCDACDSCSGVTQAAYGAPAGGCSSCAAGASYDAPLGDSSGYTEEPQPQLAPEANVPPTREERSIREKPEIEDSFPALPGDVDADPAAEPAATNDYWQAPPLFAAPSNRVTSRPHPAPVRQAVYRRGGEAAPVGFEADRSPPAPALGGKVHRLGADGWASAPR